MNNEVSKQLHSLSETRLQELLSKYRDSKLMKSYILLIRSTVGKKLSTREIVESIYNINYGNDFAKYENRFYKLRKKLLDELSNSSFDKQALMRSTTNEENQKEQCRALVAQGQFNDAETLLTQLRKTCNDLNIFELLPEVIEMLIQIKHTLNKFKETEKLYSDFHDSITLYTHISEAKILVKKIYECNVLKGIKYTEPLFKQLNRLARLHADKPRFKLIYNFVAGYYKAGAGGDDNFIKTNVISRHIHLAKKLMNNNPKMPVVNYSLNYEYIQHYRLAELESMTHFRSFRFKEAAEDIYKLLMAVLDAKDFLKRMLNEVLIANAIHMQIAAMNREKALECVQIYLKFIRDNKHIERLPRVYCELANVVSTFGIKNTFISNQKLLDYINQYERSIVIAKSGDSSGSVLFLKIKMYWLIEDYEAALKLLKTKAVKDHFNNKEIDELIDELLQLEKSNGIHHHATKDFKHRLAKLKFNSVKAEEILLFNWIGTVLEKLSKKTAPIA